MRVWELREKLVGVSDDELVTIDTEPSRSDGPVVACDVARHSVGTPMSTSERTFTLLVPVVPGQLTEAEEVVDKLRDVMSDLENLSSDVDSAVDSLRGAIEELEE